MINRKSGLWIVWIVLVIVILIYMFIRDHLKSN